MEDAFLFSFQVSATGQVRIGRSSTDNDPVRICVTSKRLMQKSNSSVSLYHIDATYKLINTRNPLVVFGRTDIAHQFYPVSFIIASHEQTEDYIHFYQSMIQLCKQLNMPFLPPFIMQDACDAEHNAVAQVFNNQTVVLMCWFHVNLNVRKHIHLIPTQYSDQVKTDIRKLHKFLRI